MAQNEFVDLYEVLKVPSDVDADRLRKRINEAYIEAQRNLDHRNPQKRLHFQQLYEVYLPEARHLLLDPARRAEYDRYLAVYRANQSASTQPGQAAARPAARGAARATAVAAKSAATRAVAAMRPAPPPPPEDGDPEKVAAEREAMWAQWKSGLDVAPAQPNDGTASAAVATAPVDGADGAAPATPAAPSVVTSPAAVAAPAQPLAQPQTVPPLVQPQTAPVAVQPPVAAVAPPAAAPIASAAPVVPAVAPAAVPTAAPPGAAPVAPVAAPGAVAGRSWSVEAPPNQEERDTAEFERRREEERTEIVRNQGQTAALVWGFVTAIVVFLVGFALLLWLEANLHTTNRYPRGVSRGVFTTLSFLLMVALGALGGWFGAQKGRQRKASELNSLPYEKLLRRVGR